MLISLWILLDQSRSSCHLVHILLSYLPELISHHQSFEKFLNYVTSLNLLSALIPETLFYWYTMNYIWFQIVENQLCLLCTFSDYQPHHIVTITPASFSCYLWLDLLSTYISYALKYHCIPFSRVSFIDPFQVHYTCPLVYKSFS